MEIEASNPPRDEQASKGLIIADWRERASGIPRALGQSGCEVQMKHLVAGDYVLPQHVVIERKTNADFIQSIYDRRLFAQVATLRAFYPSPLFLLESSDTPVRNIHPHALRGAILYVSVSNRIPILHSTSPQDSVEILLAILELLKGTPERKFSLRPKRIGTTPERLQQQVLQGLPGIGPSLAQALLAKFGSLKAVFDADCSELRNIAGIGPRKANQIKGILERQYQGRPNRQNDSSAE